MTKKEKELAIKLFKDQLDSLMKITFDQQEVWASQTMDLIKQYINAVVGVISNDPKTRHTLQSTY